MILEISKTKKRGKKRLKLIEQNIQELWNNCNRCKTCVMEMTQEETEEIFETIMMRIYPNRCQTPNHRSRKLREHKAGLHAKKTLHLAYYIQT